MRFFVFGLASAWDIVPLFVDRGNSSRLDPFIIITALPEHWRESGWFLLITRTKLSVPR